jgi:Flp pilus assembly protein TadB
MLLQTRRPVRLKAFVPSPRKPRRRPGLGDVVGRLIQVTLALYLVPVLLVVLLVSGVGMAMVAVARLFTAPIHKPVG